MLCEDTVFIIKATVPALQENGEVLTSHFYKKMFSNNPEVQPLFNSTNQKLGTQQHALASAICAYAANIDNLGILGDAVELIAQKHASLRIQPEHYPIVGKNLLLSIKEVLGAAATDEVIDAWGKAYSLLADILIEREEEIYQTQEQAPGGWRDFKYFEVVKKERESDVITSFYLKPEDGSKPPLYKPGQYITIRVPSPCGHTTMRNYSLSDKPNQDYFRISVKREDAKSADIPSGYVSNLLHDIVNVGDKIELAPPCGEFYLDVEKKRSRPLVLIGAGVGITPILSILLSTLDAKKDEKICFVQACLNENHQAFRNVIEKLDNQHSNLDVYYRYSEPVPEGVQRNLSHSTSEGFVDLSFLKSLLFGIDDYNADYYFCGPKPFMSSVYHSLLSLGINKSQIHFEFFGPKQEIEKSEPPSQIF